MSRKLSTQQGDQADVPRRSSDCVGRKRICRRPHRVRRGVCTALAVAAVVPAVRAGSPWQVWFDQAASVWVSAGTIRAGQSLRYSLEDDDVSTYYMEVGYGGCLQDWLSAGISYRQQYDRRDGGWIRENRPYADLTIRWETALVTISDRSRLEYRSRQNAEATFRYRNKLSLQYDGWHNAAGARPYFSTEAFVDESVRLRERDRTRSTLGLKLDPGRWFGRAREPSAGWAVSVDCSAMTQRTRKGGQWRDEHIASLKIGIAF